MKIGDNVFIGSSVRIGSLGGVQLGSYCAVASGALITTLDHHFRGAESIPWGEARIIKPVVLEDYVWVGRHARILPGVTVGEGAIVGQEAVVPKDVPSLAVVVGNPARIVRYRDKDSYEAMKRTGAVRSPTARCKRLWIPEDVRQKYHGLLKDVGYDTDSGTEYFEFDGAD